MPDSRQPFRVTIKSDGTYIVDCPNVETEDQIREGFWIRTTRDLDGEITALDLHLEPKAIRRRLVK